MSDLIVLEPCWLTQSVCGELLSADFFARSASTFAAKGGSYSLNEFQASVANYFKFAVLPQITFSIARWPHQSGTPSTSSPSSNPLASAHRYLLASLTGIEDSFSK